MQIGYARVSTKDQELDLQINALNHIGCEKIYQDQKSGSNAALREGLQSALNDLRLGDCFVVWKLDRLGRNVKDLIIMVEQLEQRGIHFKSLTDSNHRPLPPICYEE
ncbi:recombinase family protein [uncultured Shewanella sp.]|uniref:recombinase family protein n=1 Tax=uncultured Shewanella sp. TaxID=173975 RepID=UPI0026087621|nr:recombinase family protein [uncultured Shewanella sp.]